MKFDRQTFRLCSISSQKCSITYKQFLGVCADIGRDRGAGWGGDGVWGGEGGGRGGGGLFNMFVVVL